MKNRSRRSVSKCLLLTAYCLLPTGGAASNEVNNLHAITFVENRLRPLIATDYALIQLNRHPLWRQRKLAHEIFQRARFGKLVNFAVQLYLQF
jgi:hypothetical protein